MNLLTAENPAARSLGPLAPVKQRHHYRHHGPLPLLATITIPLHIYLGTQWDGQEDPRGNPLGNLLVFPLIQSRVGMIIPEITGPRPID